MYKIHKDKSRYFQLQYQTSKNYIIPFIEETKDINTNGKTLEIGF